MIPTTISAEMKQHVAKCVRCRTADRIGRLCPVLRRYLNSILFALLPRRPDVVAIPTEDYEETEWQRLRMSESEYREYQEMVDAEEAELNALDAKKDGVPAEHVGPG